MEVVKRPDKVFTCERCGAKLKITKLEDLHSGYLETKHGKSVFGWFILCPYCLNHIIVEYDK